MIGELMGIPRQVPVVCKSYFISVTRTGHSHEFKRCVYKLLDSQSSFVLIHYIGDESMEIQQLVIVSSIVHVHPS